jgi:hypothetical protein
MLSNHLTLDDEDAVQAELREIQAESVSQKWVVELSIFLTLFATAANSGNEAFTLSSENRANRYSGRRQALSLLYCFSYLRSSFSGNERIGEGTRAHPSVSLTPLHVILQDNCNLFHLLLRNWHSSTRCTLPNTTHHHPSNSPKPIFRFLIPCTPPSPTSPANDLLSFRYFPTSPPLPTLPTPNVASPVPTFSPNQLMSSPSFFSRTWDFARFSA